jgi:hypothetical protein
VARHGKMRHAMTFGYYLDGFHHVPQSFRLEIQTHRDMWHLHQDHLPPSGHNMNDKQIQIQPRGDAMKENQG